MPIAADRRQCRLRRQPLHNDVADEMVTGDNAFPLRQFAQSRKRRTVTRETMPVTIEATTPISTTLA